MGDVLVRKCAKCKGALEINIHDIHDIALRCGKYYHTSCLLDYATTKVKEKKLKWQMWQEVVDNIAEYENNAQNTLKNFLYRDDLNNYLISVYNIITPPRRLFQVVADLNNGIYNKKRCNPVSTYDLLEAWKWAKHNLDKIYKNNKINGTGPKNDEERILYDLAIVVRKFPIYLERREQQKAEEIERQRAIQENIKIDYDKVTSNKTRDNSLQDISSLVDDIF